MPKHIRFQDDTAIEDTHYSKVTIEKSPESEKWLKIENKEGQQSERTGSLSTTKYQEEDNRQKKKKKAMKRKQEPLEVTQEDVPGTKKEKDLPSGSPKKKKKKKKCKIDRVEYSDHQYQKQQQQQHQERELTEESVDYTMGAKEPTEFFYIGAPEKNKKKIKNRINEEGHSGQQHRNKMQKFRFRDDTPIEDTHDGKVKYEQQHESEESRKIKKEEGQQQPKRTGSLLLTKHQEEDKRQKKKKAMKRKQEPLEVTQKDVPGTQKEKDLPTGSPKKKKKKKKCKIDRVEYSDQQYQKQQQQQHQEREFTKESVDYTMGAKEPTEFFYIGAPEKNKKKIKNRINDEGHSGQQHRNKMQKFRFRDDTPIEDTYNGKVKYEQQHESEESRKIKKEEGQQQPKRTGSLLLTKHQEEDKRQKKKKAMKRKQEPLEVTQEDVQHPKKQWDVPTASPKKENKKNKIESGELSGQQHRRLQQAQHQGEETAKESVDHTMVKKEPTKFIVTGSPKTKKMKRKNNINVEDHGDQQHQGEETTEEFVDHKMVKKKQTECIVTGIPKKKKNRRKNEIDAKDHGGQEHQMQQIQHHQNRQNAVESVDLVLSLTKESPHTNKKKIREKKGKVGEDVIRPELQHKQQEEKGQTADEFFRGIPGGPGEFVENPKKRAQLADEPISGSIRELVQPGKAELIRKIKKKKTTFYEYVLSILNTEQETNVPHAVVVTSEVASAFDSLTPQLAASVPTQWTPTTCLIKARITEEGDKKTSSKAGSAVIPKFLRSQCNALTIKAQPPATEAKPTTPPTISRQSHEPTPTTLSTSSHQSLPVNSLEFDRTTISTSLHRSSPVSAPDTTPTMLATSSQCTNARALELARPTTPSTSLNWFSPLSAPETTPTTLQTISCLATSESTQKEEGQPSTTMEEEGWIETEKIKVPKAKKKLLLSTQLRQPLSFPIRNDDDEESSMDEKLSSDGSSKGGLDTYPWRIPLYRRSRGRRGVGRGKVTTSRVLAEGPKVSGALKPCPYCGIRRRSHLRKHLMSMHKMEVKHIDTAKAIQQRLSELFTKHGVSRYPENYIKKKFGIIANEHWERLLIGLDCCSIQVIPKGTTVEDIIADQMPTYVTSDLPSDEPGVVTTSDENIRRTRQVFTKEWSSSGTSSPDVHDSSSTTSMLLVDEALPNTLNSAVFNFPLATSTPAVFKSTDTSSSATP